MKKPVVMKMLLLLLIIIDVQSSLLRLNILCPKPAMFPNAGVAESTINRNKFTINIRYYDYGCTISFPY
eukprot:UN10624